MSAGPNPNRWASITPGPATFSWVQRTADVGLRVFDELNATMAELTGVSPQDPGVAATYATIRQSLPTVETIDTFVSAHPVAVAQLSIQYCDALVENPTARAQYFPGFNFGAAPAAPGRAARSGACRARRR